MMGWMIFQEHVICFNIYFSIAFYEIIANKVALGVFERNCIKTLVEKVSGNYAKPNGSHNENA